ncbi:MAG TPA: hypothetical protein VGG10_02475 [Rhizomicrobium sp.]|jgi:hypothetical protein
MYKDYPLSEGALVAEICNLLHTNLPDDLSLLCEVMYTKFLPGEVQVDELTQRARADLVVATSSSLGNDAVAAKFVIEVKRASAPKSQIDADLKRLSAVRRAHGKVRTFMFLVSEAERPDRFVNADGVSRSGKHKIPHSSGYFRVRRTVKAAHAFTKKGKAQYACLIEAFA